MSRTDDMAQAERMVKRVHNSEDWRIRCFCGASWRYRWEPNVIQAILRHWSNRGGYKKHLVDYCYGIKDELRSVT